jgi:Leucine-rich repeat (LRR) protein
MSSHSRSESLKWCTLSLALASLFSCATNTPPEPAPAIKANAGPDRTVRVGQYTILDGSGSSSENGDITDYKWTADEDNPTWTYLSDGEAIQHPGFYVEGVYRYRLVVYNANRPSLPDEVAITVIRRPPGIFADSCLELSVRYELKMPTQELTEEVLFQLDSVRISFGKICSLEGIEACSNLRYALLGLQAISDVSPLADLSSLEFLWLDQNYLISDISPLSGLTQLRQLNLQANRVSDLSPLGELRELEYLNIMDNDRIDDISGVANLTKLRELWIQHSLVSSIDPISRLTHLHTLWITRCEVADITPLSSLVNLAMLNLDFNKIVDISALGGLTALEMLYLGENQVRDVSPIRGLTQLARLRLSYNQITDITPIMENAGLGSGDVLSLAGNPLDSVSVNVCIPELRVRGVTVIWP